MGSASESGKFSAPELTFRTLCALADYVIVEADGSKRLPLKAHAAHEPVIPPETNQTILVVGASGFGRPMRESVHRAPIAAQALDVSEDTTVTPELWAKFLNLEALHTRVLVNQTENEPEQQAAQGAGCRTSLPGVHGGITEGVDRMLVLIRGAGDLATGIALRLFRSHLCVVMTDLPQPTAIRRTVCFSQAILYGSYQVEDVTAERAETEADVPPHSGGRADIPVLADPAGQSCRAWLRPDVLVDAILAKKNLGTADHGRAAGHRRRPGLLRRAGLPRGHRDDARTYVWAA